MSTLGAALSVVMGLLWQLPGAVPPADNPCIETREFTSPITGEKFIANVLKQEVQAQSFDYDRCPHPPINTLAYLMVTDPASGYTAYVEEFSRPCAWSAEDLKRILGKPGFSRHAPEGLPWSGAYPWEQYENAARLSEAAGEPASWVANYWLLAAWSVRLDVISGHNEFDGEVAGLLSALPCKNPDAADLFTPYEVQLAHYWEKLGEEGGLPDVAPARLDLALAWLYRSRGELFAARHNLAAAVRGEPALPKEDLLYRYLVSSVDLESNYLRTAASWYQKGWEKAEFMEADEGRAAFLLGEIMRRCGRLSEAVEWYDRALALNRGALSTNLIERQRELASTGRGY